MEKLIMLLDIYEEEVVWVHSVWDKITYKDEARIISEKFWFIKRLIDSNKIDVHKIDTIATLHEEWEDVKMILRDSRCSLIMALSISDNPIEDLILYLK